jgi:hypothetical protein
MQRLATGVAAVGILLFLAIWSGISSGAKAFSIPSTTASAPEIDAKVEERNPWTHLKINNSPRNFQFAIVTDRTGGHRPGVFAEAVNKLNLLQPEFVFSVGDLIEGYSEDPGAWALEWSEFQSKVQKLEMPFFYVVGNHDISNGPMSENWARKFGRKHYDVRYQDVLFLAINTEGVPNSKPYRIDEEQQKWAAEVLEKHKDARWTFIFLHKPVWKYGNDAENGWGAIEKALGERGYTVFAGHEHEYERTVRNNRDYIMLATTGGASKLRGRDYGEFDHITWVTMKDGGPVIANVLLDGIEGKQMRNAK